MVHHRAVGDEGQRAGQVRVAELARVRAEEILRPGPGKELHGHGVDLAGLKRGPLALARDNEAAGEVGEGVAGLMGDHVHIPGRAVEIGQDEGLMVRREAGAVSASPLVLPRLHVKRLCLQHKVNELPGFLTHVMVHRLGRSEDGLLPPWGTGPLRKDEVVVVQAEGVHPNRSRLLCAIWRPGGRYPGGHSLGTA